LANGPAGGAQPEAQRASRTGENPPYGMRGGIEETSASCEARYAPRSYPPSYCRAILRFSHSSTAGNCCAEKSASVMIRSYDRAATMRPPEVAWAGAKPTSSAACAASVKLVIRLDGNV